MYSVSTNLVAETLGGNDGDLIADALVGLEVESQLGVVPLNDDLGGLLDSLGTNATHFDGLMCGEAVEAGWLVGRVRRSRSRRREVEVVGAQDTNFFLHRFGGVWG